MFGEELSLFKILMATLVLVFVGIIGLVLLEDYLKRRQICLYGEEVRKTIVLASDKGADVVKVIGELNASKSFNTIYYEEDVPAIERKV